MADCAGLESRRTVKGLMGSNPFLPAIYSSVAQLVEHVAVNHRGISSSLIGGAIRSSEQNWYCPRPESG